MLREHKAGVKTAELCRKHGISDAHNWKSKYGGMTVSEAARLRTLENENRRPKKLLAEAMLDVSALKDLLEKLTRSVDRYAAVEKLMMVSNAEQEVPCTAILVEDRFGRPWPTRYFQRKFEEAQQRAIAPTEKDRAAGVVAHEALRGLQFRDLRRTCVVRLGELGLEDQIVSAISGHRLESVKKILEVYMPRTTRMAARGVVARIGQPSQEATPRVAGDSNV